MRDGLDGIPALDSSETKLCRSSRGLQFSARNPASSVTWRKARRTLAASAPTGVTETFLIGPSLIITEADTDELASLTAAAIKDVLG
jgi:hypothetical protein